MRMPTIKKEVDGVRERPIHSMRSLLDDFMKNASTVSQTGSRMMAMDIIERKDEFLLSANMPGMTKENIKIRVDGKDLIIEAHRESEKKESDETLCRCERYQGNYRRVFSIPDNWDVEKIKASYEDGVLRLRVPKQKAQPEKEIKIS
jgi:HSP20 family protein